jgi:hypothetical protein
VKFLFRFLGSILAVGFMYGAEFRAAALGPGAARRDRDHPEKDREKTRVVMGKRTYSAALAETTIAGNQHPSGQGMLYISKIIHRRFRAVRLT